VLSKDFIAKEWPMRELHILLQRHHVSDVKLLPLLYFDTFEEFEACVKEYMSCGGRKRLWGEDLKKVKELTMIRNDKVSGTK
jgi:hypothetical protein